MTNEHMTTEQLKEWQDHMELSSQDAADALDLHLNTFLNYRRGYRSMAQGEERPVPIPKTVALACGAVVLNLHDYNDLDLEDYTE